MDHPYGSEYAEQVSKKTAKAFAGMYPLPEMGYEIVVAIAPAQRLYLQNRSGVFFLASPYLPKDKWGEVFKVKI